MLGKLIKHEFVQTSKSLVAVYGSAVATIGVLLISYFAKITIINVLASLIFWLIGSAAVIVTLIMVLKNFNDSLYGPQGYLTFTLPVKSRDILFSKFFVAAVWIGVSLLFKSLTGWIISLFFGAQRGGLLETAKMLLQMFTENMELFSAGQIFKIAVLLVFIYGLIIGSYISFVYFSVTIANTRSFQHKPLLFSVVFFFFINTFNIIMFFILTLCFPFSLSISVEGTSLRFIAMRSGVDGAALIGLGGVGFTVILAIALMIVTGYIMEKKVNVK